MKNKKEKDKNIIEIKQSNYDEYVYNKLKEAEIEMKSTNKRYSLEDIKKSMDDIINLEYEK